MNEQFATLCGNAKAAGLVVITISLDLDEKNAAEKAQMDAMKACASESAYTKDPNDATKGKKLWYNATGGTLSDDFKKIADELSNLRIVG